jgi:HEAT repeat protein
VPLVAVAAVFVGGRLVAAPSAYEQALTKLSDASPSIRAEGAATLAQGGASSLRTLLPEIDARGHGPLTKAGLVEVVKRIGVTSSQATALRALLSSRQTTTRWAAVQVIASTEGLMRADLLARAKDAKEVPAIRAAAAEALSGATDHLTAVQALASDASAPGSVRAAAIRALGTLGSSGATSAKAIAADAKRPVAERKAALFGLSQGGSSGASGLASLAEATDPWLRAHALGALVSQGDADSASTLAAAFDDDEASVRAVSLEGVIALGEGATYAEEILAFLSDDDVRVRVLAIRHVATLNPATVASETLSTLQGLLDEEDATVRAEAARALYTLGDPSGASTMEADAEDENRAVARRAARIHQQISGRRSVQTV